MPSSIASVFRSVGAVVQHVGVLPFHFEGRASSSLGCFPAGACAQLSEICVKVFYLLGEWRVCMEPAERYEAVLRVGNRFEFRFQVAAYDVRFLSGAGLTMAAVAIVASASVALF